MTTLDKDGMNTTLIPKISILDKLEEQFNARIANDLPLLSFFFLLILPYSKAFPEKECVKECARSYPAGEASLPAGSSAGPYGLTNTCWKNKKREKERNALNSLLMRLNTTRQSYE